MHSQVQPATLLKVGYDPGFNANKAACVTTDGNISKYLTPSPVGMARRKKDGLTLAGVVRPKKALRRPFHVAFDGMEYLAGPNVPKFTDPITRMDFDRFTDSPELRATFYATLYQFVNGGLNDVALAVALPVEVVQDRAQAAKVERSIKSWMLGEHVFSVDGVETVINITNVRCKIPQPVATWFDWGMNVGGQWTRGKTAPHEPTLVIDQGFNTLDMLLVENSQISERITRGDTLGMSRAAEMLIAAVVDRYGIKLELHRANDLIKDVVNKRKAEIYVGGKTTDISQIARQSLSEFKSDISNFLRQTFSKQKENPNTLLTGGGVLAVSDVFYRHIPDAQAMYEPVMANARGLAKLAARPGFLD